MGETSASYEKFKEKSLGFTLIEIMIVVAVIGILSMVTVPKYQGLIDHYHLESSAQIVAGQLRNAKQYAMDRRTNIYVMFNTTSVQSFYFDEGTQEFIELEDQKSFDSGISFESGEHQEGVKELSEVVDDLGFEISNLPPYEQCVTFEHKGFLTEDYVKITLTNARSPEDAVYINMSLDSLAVTITW